MPVPIYVVVAVGLVGTLAALVIALRAGRVVPTRRVPWVIALVALGIDSALHIAISVGALLSGGWEAMWIVLGSLAIAGVFATAWISPRIAGWWLVATAIALPAILVAGTMESAQGIEQPVPVEVMLGFYTPRMLIVGALLIWSTARRGTSQGTATANDHQPAPRIQGT